MARQLRLEYEGAVYHGWREVSGESPFTRKMGMVVLGGANQWSISRRSGLPQMCGATFFRGNRAGLMAHYFVGIGRWATVQCVNKIALDLRRLK